MTWYTTSDVTSPTMKKRRKIFASVRGRWPERADETAELLAPYDEWQGLASVFLLAGFSRGLVPGASADRARLVRAEAHRRQAA